MRGVRLQLEYAKVEESLSAWGVRSTIVVFGGGRIRPDGPSRHKNWYQQARTFARIASERGGAMSANGRVRDNVIATAADPDRWRRRTAVPRTPERRRSDLTSR